MKLNLNGMTTERRNPRTMNLDTMSELEIVTAINDEDARVPLAIAKKLPEIAQAARWAGGSLRAGRPAVLHGRRHQRASGRAGRGRVPAHLRGGPREHAI